MEKRRGYDCKRSFGSKDCTHDIAVRSIQFTINNYTKQYDLWCNYIGKLIILYDTRLMIVYDIV